MTEGYEKKNISLITVTGGMIFSVISMIMGSFLGTGGTLYGAAIGSAVSAIGGTYYENGLRKTQAKLKAKKEQKHDEETAISPAVRTELIANREKYIRARQNRILNRERNPWKTATLSLGMVFACLLTAGVTLVSVEAATGKTLHSNLPWVKQKQYGTSFSYSTVAPRIRPAPSSSASASPSGSLTAAPSPSATSASPSPDAGPDQSPTGGALSPDQTGIPTSSASATSSPSEQIAPAANAVPSSSSATGLSAAGTTASLRA